MEGRKSIVAMFALSFVLIFFAATPEKSLDLWGVEIPVAYIWPCLLIAHTYFCVMAYTNGFFRPVDRSEASWISYINAAPDHRATRMGHFMNWVIARILPVSTYALILCGWIRIGL